MDNTTLIVMSIMFVATLVRGLAGFGNALVAMPLLALVVPIRTASPVVAATAWVVTLIMFLESRRDVNFRSAWQLVVGAAIGTPIGLLFLKGAQEGAVQLLLAATIFSFSVYSLAHPRPRRISGGLSTVIAGITSGILGGAYNTNGPPVVIYGTLRGWSPKEFKATLQGFFMVTCTLIVMAHVAAGLWTKEVIRLSLWTLAPMALGLGLSYILAPRIPRERFAVVVHSLLILCSGLLVYKAL